MTDTERLDWLQSRTTHYGKGWLVRVSSIGHGMRLQETSRDDAVPTIREAIDKAMQWAVEDEAIAGHDYRLGVKGE